MTRPVICDPQREGPPSTSCSGNRRYPRVALSDTVRYIPSGKAPPTPPIQKYPPVAVADARAPDVSICIVWSRPPVDQMPWRLLIMICSDVYSLQLAIRRRSVQFAAEGHIKVFMVRPRTLVE